METTFRRAAETDGATLALNEAFLMGMPGDECDKRTIFAMFTNVESWICEKSMCQCRNIRNKCNVQKVFFSRCSMLAYLRATVAEVVIRTSLLEMVCLKLGLKKTCH